jgi:hypothetical protein
MLASDLGETGRRRCRYLIGETRKIRGEASAADAAANAQASEIVCKHIVGGRLGSFAGWRVASGHFCGLGDDKSVGAYV